MTSLKNLPIALTIAGSDSGGGAGIQADLKTFAALRVHGASAITCLTAQNPARVSGIEPCSPKIVRAQLAAVFEELPPAAAKTGMLFSAPIIRTVAAWFRQAPKVPLVVDPVMIATSGRALLKSDAVKVLENELLPLAVLVTPNLHEAEALTGARIRSVEDMRLAARELKRLFGCAALVQGGHLAGMREAVDIFFDGETELLLSAPFVKGLHLHGTGCTYSAAITAWLARGEDLPSAVSHAKIYVTRAIAHSRRAGRHSLLNHAVQP
jgi:hydroxymethylpyrimidine/phosphomethylpyrimidine kinase